MPQLKSTNPGEAFRGLMDDENGGINYIATYQAQCVDGNQVTANLALNDVPEGASPGSLIEIITEQAYADIARSGMNATSVLVLNLSRVW